MIKPFTVLKTREDPNGTTVFFSVSKTEFLEGNKAKTQKMETAVLVPTGEDQDQYIFDMLQKGGWL